MAEVALKPEIVALPDSSLAVSLSRWRHPSIRGRKSFWYVPLRFGWGS